MAAFVRSLRLGTRASRMARAQTARVAELLRGLDPALDVEVVAVTTEADRWHGDLAALGGKGGFVKEIDVRLQRGEVDVAIHCLKDVPGDVPLPDGLVVGAVLPRDDARDVLVVPEGACTATLGDLPEGATVASSSVRRKAQLLCRRPDLRVVPVRGAIGTRLERLDARTGGVDAMVVARAGLERLGRQERARYAFSVEEMLPPVGAGVLALERRGDDEETGRLLERLDDPLTRREASAERALLGALRGHCNSPLAGHCVTGSDGRLSLRGMVFTPDGTRFARTHQEAEPGSDPAALGSRAATELLGQGARGIIDAIAH